MREPVATRKAIDSIDSSYSIAQATIWDHKFTFPLCGIGSASHTFARNEIIMMRSQELPITESQYR